MQTFDDKVDAAVHVAFTALALSVAIHMELAYRLNDFITQEFQFAVSGDEDELDDDAGGAQPAETSSGADNGGGSND
ncbi:hypothetical protein D2T29_16240 [Sinirhodobacter populi]|uniref:Uncharacterized protein n=1 Tax=Paenirhodobacter populi TaxID=2306993 RepID=A0A443K7N0_9RHOB|nr:hypothetical protein [Sinirhodobacter populi]RWR28764.1 hypothetical protein D2T29_16240 [Sinirhodobacter populi]